LDDVTHAWEIQATGGHVRDDERSERAFLQIIQQLAAMTRHFTVERRHGQTGCGTDSMAI